eukprot:CAMPEP_0178897320 /NCGR_PEP_ID=MMETSP0786-20121207/1678_1 /TAXON_ID=186022 /ORGANISM="Thalassionema frauenfeldii, Strain CCMP 1798" /LENGTH=598 /DNA_ID=CAMNT_0020567851 /DNA_START=127 /DNA_END=1923 /DNA_ORIENTATION=-
MWQSSLSNKKVYVCFLLLVAVSCCVFMSEKTLRLASHSVSDLKSPSQTISDIHGELLSFYGADLWRRAKARNLGESTEDPLKEWQPARELQSNDNCSEVCSVAPTPSPTCPDGGTNCDPIILGIEGQVFKFDGMSETWYCNLAVPDASVHWNTYFHKFSGCPTDEDTFIAGAGISVAGEQIMVSIDDMDSFFPGCREGENVCLGDGSLSLLVNGMNINSPGEYPLRNGGSVIVHNTYAACSRKWYDFKESRRALRSAQSGGSRDFAIELLKSKEGTMIDPEECSEWIAERVAYKDLFEQQGGWSTIHIVTPHISMHMEYRQTRQVCFSHNLDSWISKISSNLLEYEWKGILGETRYPKYAPNGKQILSDRNILLAGKFDSDYQVEGPFETEFEALDLHAMEITKGRRLDGCLEGQVERRRLAEEFNCVCNCTAPANFTCDAERRSLQAASVIDNWDAVKRYLCGGGDVTLDETGFTALLTQRWKDQRLADIKAYICGGGTAPASWGISHDVTDWRDDWWIGGFTLTLDSVVLNPDGTYEITLSMSDPFTEPLNVINVGKDDVPSWLEWMVDCLNVELGTPFTVTHTWTETINCTDTTD